MRGAFVYHSTQWVRVFALAIFYAFSMTYEIPYGDALAGWIEDYGIYVVLCFAAIEMALLITHVLTHRRATLKRIA